MGLGGSISFVLPNSTAFTGGAAIKRGKERMLTYTRIKHDRGGLYDQIDMLYERAFPLYEKRSPAAKQRALQDDRYQLQAWRSDEGVFIGFIGAWIFKDYAYIEHLAVNDRLRSCGYGKSILKQFLTEHPVTLLEIDPPTSEIARRRLRFYQSLGFQLNDVAHYHPSYHRQFPDHLLRVLSYPHVLDNSHYQMFNDDLRQHVMGKITHLQS